MEDTTWAINPKVSHTSADHERSITLHPLTRHHDIVANLEDYTPTAPSYYPDPHQMQQPYPPPMGYGHQNHGGAPNYYGSSQHQQGPGGGYGTVSYAVGNGANPSFDSGKSIANLTSFLGDVQRGAIDMKNYSQVSNRLVPLQNNGVQYLLGGVGDYQPASAEAHVEGGQGGVFGPTTHYSLPAIDNLRTKDQLLDMGRRFEQMAATVYDIAEQTAAAGTGQPGAHFVQNTMSYRNSLSPPGIQLPSAHESAMATVSSQRSNHSGTPVLSPPSSAGGYTSGHSPDSTHSNPRLSPATPNGAMYPSLPGPSSVGYPPSNMAPTATLGTQNENDYRPRRGGGYLQKAQPLRVPRQDDHMDTSEDNATTPKETSQPRAPIAPMRPKANFEDANIDPALSGEEPSVAPNETAETPARPSTSMDSAWVESIRTLEALRKYIATRLANHDYENAEEDARQGDESETPGLYPALSGVEVGA